ncbi:Nucleoporin nup84 [Ceratocystis pirilliformis]|uniref:Nuclear pore complex protein n=1 Tax=Ceratocystis pirilliformis TaxID=259994 RepID=A0ABR3YLP8_9PEZI
MDIALCSPVEAGPEVEFFATKLDECLEYQRSGSSALEKRDRILNLVDQYYGYALERSMPRQRQTRANKPLHSSIRESDRMAIDNDDALSREPEPLETRQKWEQEAHTWDLLRRLLPLRYPEPTKEAKAASRPLFKHSAAETKQSAWDEFVQADPLAIERRAILQWLQSNSASGPDISELVQDLQQRADRGDIIAHGWIHTRSAIKQQKMMLNRVSALDPNESAVTQALRTSNGSPLVSQLDPDSLTRQGRKLQPQDEYFERSIWRGCYELLRRGSTIDEIRVWCSERTEAWRAVSMSALPLPGIDADKPFQGPSSIALWRRMCYATARNGGVDDYERAVYGILAGDIPSVEKVCLSWDDVLFANYNALLRSQFDAFALRACGSEAAASLTQSFPSFDAIQYHGDPDTLVKRLVKSMESNPLTSAEAKTPIKVLQGAILAKDLDSYFVDQGLAIAASAMGTSEAKMLFSHGMNTFQVDGAKLFGIDQLQGLRIATHIFIINSLLESLPDPATSAVVLGEDAISRKAVQGNATVAYLSLVSRAGLDELVPMYCSTLVGLRQYEVLAHNLLQVVDNESRVQELGIIRRSNLDVLKFAKTLPAMQLDAVLKMEQPAQEPFSIMSAEILEHAHGRPIKLDFMGLKEDIKIEHEYLIRSVEWLLLVDQAWPDVLNMGSRVFTYFLKNMYLSSAREFLSRVSFDRFFQSRLDKLDLDDDVICSPDDVEFWSEQLSQLPTFSVTAKQAATDARNFRDLSSLVRVLDLIETINSMGFVVAGNDPPRDFWNEVAVHVQECQEVIEPVLNNWLLTSIKEGDKDLEKIRAMYLPEVVLAWVSRLHFAGHHIGKDYLMECMDLAALIADGNSDIARVFIASGRMTELVQAFTACSKELAIYNTEKKVSGSGPKRLRESGWSRDLWSVRSS